MLHLNSDTYFNLREKSDDNNPQNHLGCFSSSCFVNNHFRIGLKS